MSDYTFPPRRAEGTAGSPAPPRRWLAGALALALGASLTLPVAPAAAQTAVTVSIHDAEVVKGDGSNPLVFPITLSQPMTVDVTVHYETVDGSGNMGAKSHESVGEGEDFDYFHTEGVARIPAGATNTTVTVRVHGTKKYGPDKTLTVTLDEDEVQPSQVGVGNGAATGTIRNNDPPPTVRVNDAVMPRPKAFDQNMPFQVRLSHPSFWNVRVDYATEDGTGPGKAEAGTDYEAPASNANVIIRAGESQATANVVIKAHGDEEAGHDKWFTLDLAACEGEQKDGEPECIVGRASARGTILSTKGPRLSVEDAATLEGDPPATPDGRPPGKLAFKVTLDPSRPERDVRVDYTTHALSSFDVPEGKEAAVEGVDYRKATGTLLIPAGKATGTITVEVIPNLEPEPDRLVGLRLSNPDFALLGREQAVGEILDDDDGRDNADEDGPQAVIAGPDSGARLAELAFSGSGSAVPDGEITEYAWAFSDGSAALRGETITKAFAEAGTYTVGLRVTDSAGGIDIATKEVTITDAVSMTRSAGTTRIETAVAVSRDHFDSATDAVLATAWHFPDALAGGALAAGLRGPLLLTDASAVPEVVDEELTRLGVARVWLLGGVAAVSQDVEDELAASGHEVHRIGGATRFHTAALLGMGLGPAPDGEVLLALGDHDNPDRAWPDALSAGALTATLDIPPTLLTRTESLPSVTEQALAEMGATTVTIIGGTAAVSETVEGRLAQLGYQTTRLAGADRYATSAAVATEALSRQPTSSVVFATGVKFPDGLAATGLAARLGAVVVLVPPDDLGAAPAVESFLAGQAGQLDLGVIVGGSAAVAEGVTEQLSSAMSNAG